MGMSGHGLQSSPLQVLAMVAQGADEAVDGLGADGGLAVLVGVPQRAAVRATLWLRLCPPSCARGQAASAQEAECMRRRPRPCYAILRQQYRLRCRSTTNQNTSHF